MAAGLYIRYPPKAQHSSPPSSAASSGLPDGSWSATLLWNTNPALFELLVLLFDRSEFLAELAIRIPDLLDELVISGRLRQRTRWPHRGQCSVRHRQADATGPDASIRASDARRQR